MHEVLDMHFICYLFLFLNFGFAFKNHPVYSDSKFWEGHLVLQGRSQQPGQYKNKNTKQNM